MSNVVNLKSDKHYEMDDLFIEKYLECNNMADSFRYAKKMLGQEFRDEYAGQYGKKLFDRLRDKISEMLDDMEVEDAALSRNVLRTLCSSAEVNPQVRVSAAKELARKRIERPSQKKHKDIDEIEAEIKRLEDKFDGQKKSEDEEAH